MVLKNRVLHFSDLQTLARAAVSGDEAALDMFNWKKGKGNMRIAASSFGPQEANCFFLGGNMGELPGCTCEIFRRQKKERKKEKANS